MNLSEHAPVPVSGLVHALVHAGRRTDKRNQPDHVVGSHWF